MILVADDDVMIVEVIRKWLEREGFDVATCADGRTAYDMLKEGTVECMLLDVNMPVLNGVELLLLLQSEGDAVPTLVMAGFADFDETEMKQFDNVIAYLQKPFDMLDMVARVRGCVGAD